MLLLWLNFIQLLLLVMVVVMVVVVVYFRSAVSLCKFPSLPSARLLLVTMDAAATAGTILTPHWVGGAAAALAAAAASAAPVAGKAMMLKTALLMFLYHDS